MNKKNSAGFTLIEVLVALAILGFVLSASLKIFSSNAQVVSALEKKTLASFVAENVLVQTYTFKNELNYATGTEFQGGINYRWERKVLFEEDGKAAQINISVSTQEVENIFQLIGYKVIQ